MYISTLHFDKRSMYTHVSTSIKSLRCRFTHNRIVSVFIWYLSLAFGLMSRRVYQGSLAIRFLVGHYMTSALSFNRVPGFAGCFAILDIHSFFALTSLRSVPAIMITGICTKRTTSSNLNKESVDERLR